MGRFVDRSKLSTYYTDAKLQSGAGGGSKSFLSVGQQHVMCVWNKGEIGIAVGLFHFDATCGRGA